MAPKGKSRNNEDLKQEDILQAVVIADSFNVRFGPVTKDKPRALLPLVNTPLLDYTLEALAVSGVQEVFVVCCHLGDQIREHIRNSKWQDYGSPMTVTAVMSDSCISMGDALREIDAKSLIRTDFILISGDLVSNMDIGLVVKEHKARTSGKDKSSVMTLVFRTAQPGHRGRSRETDMVTVEEGDTHRLLYFHRPQDKRKIPLPMDILLEHEDVIVHNDLLDCHISVCSASVPTLFTDNFDYQTRDDFVKGILINEEIMGNKIHMSIVRDKYAARVSNLQTYDSISKDVVCRWTYPFVPDIYGSDSGDKVRYNKHNIYCSKGVTLARGCELQKDVVVGSGSSVGQGSTISRCVIGKNCHIGENVSLRDAYLWDGVTVGDNCVVDTALLCSGVKVLDGVKVCRGVVLAWNVIVGPYVTIPQGTKLMSEPQRDDFDDMDSSFGEDEDEEEDEDRREGRRQAARGGGRQEEEGKEDNTTQQAYGSQSRAFLFKPIVDSDDEDEHDNGVECLWGADMEDSNLHEESEGSGSEEADSEDDEMGGGGFSEDDEEEEDVVDADLGFSIKSVLKTRNSDFYAELVDTLLRGHTERISTDNTIVEINSIRQAYKVLIEEVIASVTTALLDMGALHAKVKVGTADPQVLAAFKKNVEKYAALLKYYRYIKNLDSETVTINGLGDHVIRNPDLRPRLPQLINFLYDADILSEGSILKWSKQACSQPKGSEEAKKHEYLRKLVQPFIKWLEEAEEETSDEDDDDDDDESDE